MSGPSIAGRITYATEWVAHWLLGTSLPDIERPWRRILTGHAVAMVVAVAVSIENGFNRQFIELAACMIATSSLVSGVAYLSRVKESPPLEPQDAGEDESVSDRGGSPGW